MDDSPRFDEISTEDFRGLQEAPLASDAATASAARADDLTDEAGARLNRDTHFTHEIFAVAFCASAVEFMDSTITAKS